jgi:hypothetical protein
LVKQVFPWVKSIWMMALEAEFGVKFEIVAVTGVLELPAAELVPKRLVLPNGAEERVLL